MPKIEDAESVDDDVPNDKEPRSQTQGLGEDVTNGELHAELETTNERGERATAESSSGDDNENDDGENDGDNKDDEDQEEDEEDGEDEDEDEEEYEVEEILAHRFTKGVAFYHIHWKGYDKAKDFTWEPTSNILPGARGKLAEYHAVIGGEPKPPQTVKKSKSKQSLRRQSSTEDSPTPNKRRKLTSEDEFTTWEPKKQDWEPEVDRVDSIERDANNQLLAFLHFKNGKKVKVSMDKVYRHCPRPMLKFYESHLHFKLADQESSPAD